VTCAPAWAALAAPPLVATPAISVITPTAMAILVVQRIRIPVPFGQRPGFPPEALTSGNISQETDESRAGAP